MLIEFIKRASTGGSAGMADADALALKAAIEAKGGTVTMEGDVPTVAELSAGIAGIPGTPVSISISGTVPNMPTITEATA